MRPRVILYNAASVDGRIEHLSVDLHLFYGIAGSFREDATLAGSGTIVQATSGVHEDTDLTPLPPRETDDPRPVLVIPDSRGRIRVWKYLLQMPFWGRGIALVSRQTPPDYLRYLSHIGVEYLITGEDRIALPSALRELYQRFGIRVVRVDSGGTLNGVLLRAGLVDEVHLLVHPCLVGGLSPRSIFRAPDLEEGAEAIPLRLVLCERLAGDIVRLGYQVGQE